MFSAPSGIPLPPMIARMLNCGQGISSEMGRTGSLGGSDGAQPAATALDQQPATADAPQPVTAATEPADPSSTNGSFEDKSGGASSGVPSDWNGPALKPTGRPGALPKRNSDLDLVAAGAGRESIDSTASVPQLCEERPSWRRRSSLSAWPARAEPGSWLLPRTRDKSQRHSEQRDRSPVSSCSCGVARRRPRPKSPTMRRPTPS